jgi:hypothetical protein
MSFFFSVVLCIGIALIQVQCSDMGQNNLGNGQQIPYNLPNKKLERL